MLTMETQNQETSLINKSDQKQKTLAITSGRNYKNEIEIIYALEQNEKIRNLPKEEIAQGIAVIFASVLAYSGFKEGIHKANKRDLMEMICTRYRHLSLPEINHAFKVDRYGYHGEPTKHYQLFNAEFVATVLMKYEKWKQAEKERYSKEKSSIERRAQDCFMVYREFGKITQLRFIYEHLYSKGVLPDHNKRFRQKIIRKSIKRFYKDEERISLKEKNKILLDLQKGKIYLRGLCRRIIVETFFRKIIHQRVDFQTLLK